MKMRKTLWKYACARAGRDHADDICSKVALALYRRLLSGPLEEGLSINPYLWVMARNIAGQHLLELAERAESFVGDDTTKLEDPDQHISVHFTSRVEFDEAMSVVKKDLTTLQLRAFVLAEGRGSSPGPA
ncbi:hypothetical protein [Streptomyces sp. NPDC000983]|uniref:hypothetical protein n=1 Tax=Streptomyces sp. NPDC000983 TaxID=3154373 RepID=UPI00332F4053